MMKITEYLKYVNPMDLIKDFPNYIKNVIICYALQNTRLYATTLYEITKHTSQTEMNVYFEMRNSRG